jgi:hypothetical protein
MTAKLADLPPEYNPRRMAATGVGVLEHGLPALPEVLTYQMAVPIAYWKADRCAAFSWSQWHGMPMLARPQATFAGGRTGGYVDSVGQATVIAVPQLGLRRRGICQPL